MKALTLTAVNAPLELLDRDPPTPKSADEVVVDLKAASLNRRDHWISRGMYPSIICPVVLGSDGAGIEFGSQREVIINPGWDWGDNQYAQSDQFSILGMPVDGTFAEQVVVPKQYVHDKPEHLDWSQAAALPLAGVTAYRALFVQAWLKQGDTVLINGVGGGVAAMAMRFAIAVGANVWVTSSSDEKIATAIRMGAKGGANYTADKWWKELAKQSVSPNVIVDSAGGSGYNALISLAAPGACIVNYGATVGPPEKLDLFKVFWKQLTLKGSTMGSPSDFASMLDFVTEHQIAPLIEQEFPLAEGNSAIELMAKSPQFGKYVLRI